MTRFSVTIINYGKWLSGKDGEYPDSFEATIEATSEVEALKVFNTIYGGQYEVQAYTLRNIGKYANRKEQWEAEWKAMREAEDKKKTEAKARKEAREKAEAEAMGITVEEYRNKKKNEAKARKVRREIEELKAEIARKETYLAKLEA